MVTNTSFIYNHQFIKKASSTADDLQELVGILQRIVSNAGALLEVPSCSVALIDASGTTLVTLATLQKNRHRPRNSRFRLDEGAAGWVAKHRRPLVINDASQDTRFKRLGRVPVGSMLCVPLIDQDRFIGTLTASSQETQAFDEKKVRMLSIFAEQAVLAIVSARHAELAEHQTNQLEMLIDLSRDITMRLEPRALYRTILTDVQRLVACRYAFMYEYRANQQYLYKVAEWSESGVLTVYDRDEVVERGSKNKVVERISLHDEQSLAAWAAGHRHPMLREPQQGVRSGEEAAPMGDSPAELAIPFVSKDTLYGVLVLQRKEAFTSEELRLMRNLGYMAAVGLENVQLFHQVSSDQEELRTILATSSDGIALLDEHAAFIETNGAFAALFDMQPEQLVGMECMELLGYHEDQDCASEGDERKIKSALLLMEPLPSAEIDVLVQDISRTLSVSITPVTTANHPTSLLVVRDVTEIRDASRMKARFLSMIAHELRSPLNGINGYLDLTLEGIGGELNEQQQEFIQRARAGSEHLYSLIEDLLLVSRADAGQLRLNREVLRLQDSIADAVEEMELTSKDANVAVEVVIGQEFPSLWADPIRLRQVLRNLLSNAFRFTPRGGRVVVAAQVLYELEEAEEEAFADDEAEVTTMIKLSVSDTGCGIAPEHHERIFERFYQVHDSSGNRSGGQGLGLAIVKMIIELHGGHVEVESVPGEGSTFSCFLPRFLA